MSTRDTHSRSIVKGASWRVLGTIDTTLIAWFVTGNPLKALSIGAIEVFTKVFLYYLHERAWLRVKWGLASPNAEVLTKPSAPTAGATAAQNIHPIFERLVDRTEKEKFLGQKGKVLWLTGLSGSGKSTIAQLLEKELLQQGYFTKVLDGDNIRTGINKNLGFSLEERQENVRRIAEVAKLFAETGVITICSFISPTKEIRQFARDIIGEDHFIEIYIDTPLEVCESRDVKGLYEKARAGKIKNFTGIDSPYEPPENPAITIDTVQFTVEQAVDRIIQLIKPSIAFAPSTSN